MVIKWANMVNLQKVFLCKVEPFVPNIDRLSLLSQVNKYTSSSVFSPVF